MTESAKQMKKGISPFVLIAIVLVSLPLVGCAARSTPRDPIDRQGILDPNSEVEYLPTVEVPPPTVPTLLAPHEVRILARGVTSVTLQFRDRMDLEDGYNILRSSSGGVLGTFQEVQDLGALDEGFHTFVDSSLEPDTLYCYRVKVTSGAEWDVSEQHICTWTRGAEARPIFRAQLEITTASFPEAATSDMVSVRLNSPPWAPTVPGGNITYLDRGLDDFLPGSMYAYDLTPPRDLHDITLLQIEKGWDGGDGLCIAGLRLVLNRTDGYDGDVVFEQNYGDTPSTCHWLDRDEAHEPLLTFYHEDLRANPSWP
jgi:hypothetical protein